MDKIIPNQFHFIFGLEEQKEPFHLVYYLCIESCRQINQPDKIYFYYHHEPYGRYWELAKKHLILEKIDPDPFVSRYSYGDKNKYCKKYNYAHHSDFIRLKKLIERGGIYADMDTIFVNRIPDYLFTKPFVLGREDDVPVGNKWPIILERLIERGGTLANIDTISFRRNLRHLFSNIYSRMPSLGNAFIMCPKDSTFGKIWLEATGKEFDGSWSKHSTILPSKLSEEYPDLIHIEPKRSFYKHMWTSKGIKTLFEECDKDFEGVFSMHLWSHLWWSKKRKDFSSFHEALITEDNIRNSDTTYNIVARQFLPIFNDNLTSQ